MIQVLWFSVVAGLAPVSKRTPTFQTRSRRSIFAGTIAAVAPVVAPLVAVGEFSTIADTRDRGTRYSQFAESFANGDATRKDLSTVPRGVPRGFALTRA